MTPDFGLIETLLYTPGEGVVLEAAHLARISTSARHFDFLMSDDALKAALDALVAQAPHERRRLRLVLNPDGRIETSASPLPVPAPGLVWRATLARERFASSDPLLRHKTTLRARYEAPLVAAGTDEVIFLNGREEICEAARSNVFLERGGVLLTPPLACGLLPGTLRGQLLAEGRAREAVLTLQDLSIGTLYLGNSVRGLVRAVLV